MKILLLILAMFITKNAKALDEITSIDEPWTQDATVGEVDSSLSTYDIEIEWSEFVYDYVYNEENDSYDWISSQGTSEAYLSITDKNHVNSPVTPMVLWESTEEYDFVKGIITEEGSICIESEYNEEDFNDGFILTGAQCNENPKYSLNDPNHSYDVNKYYVSGSGYKYLVNNQPSGMNASGAPNIYSYLLFVSLENDPEKEAKTPKTGDTIGTLTIRFEAEEPNDQ